MSLGKIAVVGSGAIGSYYGAALLRHGCDVHFLMRSDLQAVRERGLIIRSEGNEIHLPGIRAYASTNEIGASDLVLIAVKTTSNDDLPELIRPLLHQRTALLTLQNGLGNEEFLAKHFGDERILGGLCFVCLNRVGYGVIEHYGHGTLSVGEYKRPPSQRTDVIVKIFQAAGIEARVVENLISERWRKLVWNVPFNGLSIAAGEITVDEILAHRGLHQLTRDLMREVIDAGAALGHSIPLDFIDEQFARTYKMGAYRPSSLIDYANARAVEVEAIWGEPYRRGKMAGAVIPRMEMLYALLDKLVALRCVK